MRKTPRTGDGLLQEIVVLPAYEADEGPLQKCCAAWLAKAAKKCAPKRRALRGKFLLPGN